MLNIVKSQWIQSRTFGLAPLPIRWNLRWIISYHTGHLSLFIKSYAATFVIFGSINQIVEQAESKIQLFGT